MALKLDDREIWWLGKMQEIASEKSEVKGGVAEGDVSSNALLGREAAHAKREEGRATRPLGRRSRPNDEGQHHE